MTSTGSATILRPRWSSASSKELRMSLPITAVGPLNVLTKPIFTDLPWAMAGPAASNRTAPAAINVLFILFPPYFPLGDDIADRLPLAYDEPLLDARQAVRIGQRRLRKRRKAIQRIPGELVQLDTGGA